MYCVPSYVTCLGGGGVLVCVGGGVGGWMCNEGTIESVMCFPILFKLSRRQCIFENECVKLPIWEYS